MDSLEAARAKKAAAQASLDAAMSKVQAVEAKVEELRQSFTNATEEKQRVEEDAQACLNRLELAERLVNGLASENVRWTHEIADMRKNEANVLGDCLLAAGF
eukprot:10406855-Prorocentrum_lima.AAC.1